MKVAIACDHGGYLLKPVLTNYLEKNKIEYVDFGTDGTQSVDYPDYALPAAECVARGECDFGILICGTGIGMSIAANRHKGIRAALCTTELHARFTRLHNNANVLCLGARVTGVELALAIVDTFLSTGFEGGRHQRRIDLLNA